MGIKATQALCVLSELEADISKATKKLEAVKKELEGYEKLKNWHWIDRYFVTVRLTALPMY